MNAVRVLFRHSFLAGTVIWLVLMIVCGAAPLSVEWPLLMVAFGAMIAVPVGLETLRRHGICLLRHPLAVCLPAWGGIAFAVRQEAGWIAAFLTLPWLLVTIWLAASAVREWRRGERALARTVTLSGPVLLAVGGAWLFADRAGWEPFGFDFLIVRLTAAHFHFAGFVLPVITGLTLQNWGTRPQWLSAAAAGVMGGIPLVAAGITLTRWGAPVEVECALAVVFSICAGTAGAAQVVVACRAGAQTDMVRALLTVSGVCLMAGMSLALLYALRPWLVLPWLHLPRMWALHGTIQVFGFALPGLAGWMLWRRDLLRDERTLACSDGGIQFT